MRVLGRWPDKPNDGGVADPVDEGNCKAEHHRGAHATPYSRGRRRRLRRSHGSLQGHLPVLEPFTTKRPRPLEWTREAGEIAELAAVQNQ